MNVWSIIGGVTGVISLASLLVAFGKWTERFNNSLKRIESLESQTKDIEKIKNILIMQDNSGKIKDIFSQKYSPRALNPLGNEQLTLMNGLDFLKENKEVFFKEIDKIAPKSALDVEQAAGYVCTSLTSEPFFKIMKDYVYNAPMVEISDTEKKEITLADVCFILSIPLRDMYLEEHPNLKP